jgi:2-keto-4-pentenoate hydratase/2-oxohepta-3-ene-1,7-dioic acid hydratase in catechol pathway
MTRFIRFALEPGVPLTAPDSHPTIRRGVLEEGGQIRMANGYTTPLNSVKLLPCVSPSKIVCVGRNYADHAKELGNAVPAEPILFFKPPSSLNAHRANIVYPALSELVSFEGEVGVVIGSRCRKVKAADAESVIAGYTVVNDITARDIQKRDGQWTRGKGFDSFCPVGPWWVPKEEVDFASFRVQTRVNGELKQDGPVADMLFPVAAILEYITAFMTLEPGDLIATGTPPGVGPLAVGDVVTVEVTGLGALENTVVAEK